MAVESTAAPTTTTSSSRPAAGSDDMRANVRTMMGLLMKHKGGPGFGAGRIVGPERERFENLAQSVTATLREEAMLYPDPELEGEGMDLQVGTTAPAAMAPATPNAASAPPASPAVAAGSVTSMIACIEGAMQMYKNSPPELHESVIVTLRAALLSAVNTCNELVGEGAAASLAAATSLPTAGQAQASRTERVQSMISCIEGAIQMYRNSPPELQSSILVTLRAALLSAVGTCNGIIADQEVENVQSYQQQQQQHSPPPPPVEAEEEASQKERDFYAVVPTEGNDLPEAAEEVTDPSIGQQQAQVEQQQTPEPAQQQPPVHAGDDPNTAFLIDVYDRLSAAAGDGNLGLKQDISPEEAAALSADIADARVLLVDELENGIPKENDSEQASKTASKYRDLLTRAKAATS